MKLTKKRMIALGCVVMMLAIMAVPCFAAEPSLETAMTEGIGLIKDQVLSIIMVVIPAGLAIFGIIFAVRKGIAALRSTGGGGS